MSLSDWSFQLFLSKRFARVVPPTVAVGKRGNRILEFLQKREHQSAARESSREWDDSTKSWRDDHNERERELVVGPIGKPHEVEKGAKNTLFRASSLMISIHSDSVPLARTLAGYQPFSLHFPLPIRRSAATGEMPLVRRHR